MSYSERLIDKRVVDRYIAKGMVDRDQYQSYLEALPDMEHNAAAVLEDEEAAESEGDEGETEATAAASVEAPTGYSFSGE